MLSLGSEFWGVVDLAAYQLINETLDVFRDLGDKHPHRDHARDSGHFWRNIARAIGMLNRSTRRASHSVAKPAIHSSSRHHSTVSVASRLDRATMQQRGPLSGSFDHHPAGRIQTGHCPFAKRPCRSGAAQRRSRDGLVTLQRESCRVAGPE